MHLNLLFNSAVSLDRSPSPGSIRSHWLGHLPSFNSPATLKVLLNATWTIKSLRVKSFKEVGHLNKVWPVILLSKLVILQGTLVGHLKAVNLKDLNKLIVKGKLLHINKV